MARTRTQYECQGCGHVALTWTGQCPGCREWNTLVETRVEPARGGGSRTTSSNGRARGPLPKPQKLGQVKVERTERLRTGIGEEDALSLVTNRTATVFGLEDRVGSLQPGLDADFVIWSGHPLSQFTRAEQTWIDGRKYFDLAEHVEHSRSVERERAQLIQLILDDDSSAGGSR